MYKDSWIQRWRRGTVHSCESRSVSHEAKNEMNGDTKSTMIIWGLDSAFRVFNNF